jgi:uncharacterized membrane protein YccC
MKQLFIILALIVLAITPTIVLAQTKQGQGVMQKTQDPTTHEISSSPSGVQVQNQNQVKTKNQGEDSMLQVNTQEQENLDSRGEGLQNRNQNAIENMSVVAKKVQELLQIRTSGGIGDQVRQIAQEQNQSQTQISEQINKLNSKTQLARLFTGTDYKALKSLEKHMEQNQLRIKQLEELQNQLTNKGDLTTVEETILALIQENTSLQESVVVEKQTKSLFGWLFKLFVK